MAACHLRLNSEDFGAINDVLSKSEGVAGQVYGLERCMTGRHGSIMKYNLNQVNQASHLEELCERWVMSHDITNNIGIVSCRFVDLYFSAHPEEATKMGYRSSVLSDEHLTKDLTKFDYFKYSIFSIRSLSCDAMVTMNSKEEIHLYTCQVKALLHEVEGINCDALNRDQLVDLQLITSRMMLELLLWEELQRHKKDLLHYLSVDGIMLLLPVWGDDKEGEENRLVHPSLCNTSPVYRSICLLSRLRMIPLLLMHAEQAVCHPCREITETAICTCQHLEVFLTKEFPKYVSAIANAHLLDELLSAARISAACVNKFCHHIQQNLLPVSVTGNIPGADVYKKILQYEHFIEDVQELLTIGETRFAELKEEMDLLAQDISPGRSWQEVTKDVIRQHHPSADKLLDCYMSEIDKAKSHVLTKDVISPMAANEQVLGFYTPEILRPFSPFGDFLNPPPFGVSNTGLLMLHPVKSLKLSREEEERLLQAHDYTWIRVIACHECYPGHHVQMLCAQKNPRILRKFMLSVYFYEGWGLYTEELAYETGFYARELLGDNNEVIFSADQCEKLTHLTQLRLQLWRAARVILDIKLNMGHMTFKECCQFLEHEVMFDSSSSGGEVFMYLSRPGYAPCYLAGYVELMKLRDQVKKKMGSEFNLKTFHNSLLAIGCLPFKFVHALLH